MSEIVLNDIIVTDFRSVVGEIIDCTSDEIVLKGGRSSTKSQTIADSIVIGVMKTHQSAICLVKYAVGIESRLVNTFRYAIDLLGVDKYWKLRKAPYEFVLLDNKGKETDISIKFNGCDKPDTLKSTKSRSGGGFRYLWIEEACDFNSEHEILNIEQSMLRGAGKHSIILSYNPPMSASTWLNAKYNKPCGKALGFETNYYRESFSYEFRGQTLTKTRLVHHSTYLDVVESGHEEWLGSILVNALQMKESNAKFYEWAYLGRVVGTDGNVFSNICKWEYDNSVFNGKIICRGLDCSNGGPDPWGYIACWYDKKNNDLYIIDECKIDGKASLEQVALHIREKASTKQMYIDSAVPTFGRQLNRLGIQTLPVSKGKDSVKAGILWLQSMCHIYIDINRCPNAYKEFTEYEYIVSKEGKVTDELPDKNNHFIDACRYACSTIIKYGNI